MSRARGLRNVGSLRRKLRKLPDEMRKPIRDALQQGAQDMEQAMISAVPRDEGVLAENISSKLRSDGLSAKIGFRGKRANKKAFYARFVEFGTQNMNARPFIVPAFERISPDVVATLRDLARRALRKAGMS